MVRATTYQSLPGRLGQQRQPEAATEQADGGAATGKLAASHPLLPAASLVSCLLLWTPSLTSPLEPQTPLEEAGQQLADRLDTMRENNPDVLPEDLLDKADELAESLRKSDLSREEAQNRLEALKQEFDEHLNALEASGDLLDELEEAARKLDEASTEKLAKALETGNLEAAAEAPVNSIKPSIPQAKKSANRLLKRSRKLEKKLSQSNDEQMSKLGEALERAGQQLDTDNSPSPGQGSRCHQVRTPKSHHKPVPVRATLQARTAANRTKGNMGANRWPNKARVAPRKRAEHKMAKAINNVIALQPQTEPRHPLDNNKACRTSPNSLRTPSLLAIDYVKTNSRCNSRKS